MHNHSKMISEKLWQKTPQALKIRLEAFAKMNNTRVYQDRRFKFLGLCSALAFGLIFALPDHNGAEAKTELLATNTAVEVLDIPAIDLTRDDLYLADYQAPQSQKTLTLNTGDSLGPLLQKNGVDPNVAYEVTKSFSSVYDPRRLRAGQNFNLYFSNGNLTHLTYKPNVERTVFVSKGPDDSYTSKEIAAEFRFETISVKANIENSLYLDANALGAPDKVIQQFANIYEYSVDFQRDIQPGDAFEMFFEVARDKKGNVVKAGDLLYTSFAPRGKAMNYYLYEDADGRENFYDKDGKTAKRKLRATPINGARLSSRFGKRRHPILGYQKMHSGIDFAAPRGTPIMAAGTGVVEYAGRYGGYGNYIRLRHSDGYKTAYAHMKGFARGIRKGSHVRQDQVIGYVGSTGRSTGPHLHYEVIHNGKRINPRRLSQLSGKPLSKSEMTAFNKRRETLDNLRNISPVFTPEMHSEEPAVLSAEFVNADMTQDALKPVDIAGANDAP